MGKRSGKNIRKAPISTRVKYQEKVTEKWTCQICNSLHEAHEVYCMDCYQELYYYCYINNTFFVAKDEAYLSMYHPAEEKEAEDAKSTCSVSTLGDSDGED